MEYLVTPLTDKFPLFPFLLLMQLLLNVVLEKSRTTGENKTITISQHLTSGLLLLWKEIIYV